GDTPAPVVSDQRELLRTQVIGERGEVLDEQGDGVVTHLLRLRGEVVAAHVQRHRLVIAPELGELPPPRVPELGEAVDEHDERALALGGVVKALAVDVRVVVRGHEISSYGFLGVSPAASRVTASPTITYTTSPLEALYVHFSTGPSLLMSDGLPRAF